MVPVPLDVKLEIILDGSSTSQPRYFPGDAVHGKVFFTANQSHTLRNFRLAWTGRIHVQPIQSNSDQYTYFNECWKLGPNLVKSTNKAQKGTSSVPCYDTQLILAATSSQEPKVELQRNKTVALAFTVHVPNDRPLPSWTESVGVSPNKIMYMLEAFVDKPTDEKRQKFFAQRVVHVFEPIYTKTPDMMTPQRAEQIFTVSIPHLLDFTSAMRVTLPCRGCVPGIAIPVSISIWNTMEFTRRQGISISLFRINQVLANGRAYTSQGEKVHRVVADLNITASDTDNSSQKVQTVRIGLPIPRGTMPTITLEQSQLLAVSYFIRVQVFAQEGTYTTTDGRQSKFMLLDIPFIVGTLSTPGSSSSSTASPLSSPKSASSHAILYSSTPTTSPPPATYKQTSPRISSPPISSPPISSLPISSPPISSPPLSSTRPVSLPPPISSPPIHSPPSQPQTISSPPISTRISPQSTLSLGNERKSIMGGMFRKSSTGSQSSASDEKRNGKKKSMFSSFRLYNNKKKNVQQGDASFIQQEDADSVRQEDTVSIQQEDTVIVQQDSSIKQDSIQQPPIADNASNITGTTANAGGVFDIFARDDIDEMEPEPIKQPVFSETKKEESRVFQMFPDDDDESDYEPEQVAVPQEASKRINRREAEFKMFADEQDSDSEEEQDEHLQLLDAITDTMASFATDQQQPKKQSNVFKMFNDDDSSSDEEAIPQMDTRVKPHHDESRYQKPNEFVIEYKPDTKDTDRSMKSTRDSDSDDDDDDINDLLSVLAKREKLLSNQHMK